MLAVRLLTDLRLNGIVGLVTKTLTIRNLDTQIKVRLRIQAAQHGRSMEEEVRAILRAALPGDDVETGADLAGRIHGMFAVAGGFEMPELPASFPSEPPRFDEA